ncbi:MAG: histidine kinase dimerization/phospho-acceptor domain-containing protein [Betaproteobacteria bacterium]
MAIALYFLERAESTFYQRTTHEQNAFFAQAQADLLREQKAAARANLLGQHEASHVNLAKVIANAMWNAHFAPLVARAQRVPIESCRGLPSPTACYADLGRQIMAMPGFAEADAAVHAMMSRTTVFKIKVYDLRGLTVYSSEHRQVGEDEAGNAGWAGATKGKPASDLVHRDRFNSFDGVVENRDLIQSYMPVFAPGGSEVTGVFEIYSDVTPLLRQMDAYSQGIEQTAAENQARIESAAQANQRNVDASTDRHFAILGGLLVFLYASLWVIVRNGQRIIDEQQRARQEAELREQAAHREKMAALAAMAANASHEIGNPLAVISGLADDIERAGAAGEPLGDQPRQIQEQAARIAELTRRITEFAAARRETSEPVDVNAMIGALCDFLSFDDRYRGTRIEPRLSPKLPAAMAIPDHLNEVLMSLLQAHAEAAIRGDVPGARVVVSTQPRGKDVAITIAGECESGVPGGALNPSDVRVDSARRRVSGMGGRLVSSGARTEIFLPPVPEQQ